MKTRLVPIILSGLLIITLTGLVYYAWIAISQAQVVVEWSTASELDTVGFNIYRSETPNGPGVIVNKEIIPPAEDALTGGNYRYIDSNVVPGRVYYYFLEDISANGSTNTNGPVVVKAQTSVKMAWILIVMLAVAAAACILILRRPRRKAG